MAMDEEYERKEGTTAVAEEDAWRNRDDLAMTGRGTLEGSADCGESEPALVLSTTLSSPPVEGDDPRSKKIWALLLLVLVLLIATIIILVFRDWYNGSSSSSRNNYERLVASHSERKENALPAFCMVNEISLHGKLCWLQQSWREKMLFFWHFASIGRGKSII